MSDIFQEVDEDYRRDQILLFWKENSGWVAAILLAGLLGTGGYSLWQHHMVKKHEADTLAFSHILQDAETTAAAETATKFATLADKQSGHLKVLARLAEAKFEVQANNSDAAIKTYDTVADMKNANSAERGLAQVSSILLQVDKGDPQALLGKLAPLEKSDNAWRFSAKEAHALLAMKQGDSNTAHQILNELVADKETPAGISAAAQQLLRQ